MRSWTIDAPDERLKHAPRMHVEQLYGDMDEAKRIAGHTPSVGKTTAQEDKAMKTSKKAVKKNGAKVATKRTPKAPFAVKFGRVKDKQYAFESQEHENLDMVLAKIRQIAGKAGYSAGLREVIISVRG